MTLVAGTASSASASTNYSGTLTDGATWTAQVPDNWNGILLLAVTGSGRRPFRPRASAAAHPERCSTAATRSRAHPTTRMARGGRSKAPAGTSSRRSTRSRPRSARSPSVLALGTSMGGLVSALMAEQGAGIIDGALSTCGLVAGAIHLNNYQLDAEYAIAKLLMPAPGPKLVDFANPGEGAASGAALTAAVQPRRRVRKAAHASRLSSRCSTSCPSRPAFRSRRRTTPRRSRPRNTRARFSRSRCSTSSSSAATGSSSRPAATDRGRGEDFAGLLNHSPYHDVVRELYRTAGLDLKADLETLDAGATIGADPDAIASLEETSVPTGELEVPQLTLHTTGPARPRPARERLRGRRPACRGSSCCGRRTSTAGATALHAGRDGGGRPGAQASGRDGSLGLCRAAADAAGVGERARARRRSVRALRATGAVRRQRPVRPGEERTLTSS